ncbi:hypothetical protein Ctob_008775 [Chrysochromulina tobinii]|uniref:Uncharacterized protein n=1 Tax=Chrysochromulina tobinii TaxID=1460289 RepID=A0A0M0JU50_9EUKA|nr:hypothetical protein Ctob_008775 [Chrysochromulina tobinii]|eukprot:KOO29872.1 hypothetical protein Ctob_008775 [Chrysochromulina sp. CCMP291]
MLVPLATLVGCDSERDGSVSCTSQHIFMLARGMASGAHASAPARSLFVGCFLASLHASATVLAFIEALQSAISVGLPLYLIFLFTHMLDLKRALVLAMYAQTMPLVLNGLFEGPLRPIDDWLESLAAGAEGWEVDADDDDPLTEAMRWAHSGLGPGQASVLFWLLHFVLALCAARETLRARHGDGATVTITSPQPRSVVQVNASQYWQFVEAPWYVRFGQPWQQRCWQMQHQAMRLAWAQAAALQQAHAQAFSYHVVDRAGRGTWTTTDSAPQS